MAPPKRRKRGDGASDRAAGLCAKCCNEVCKISPWNQALCWAIIIFTVVVGLLWVAGASLSEPAADGLNAPQLCTDEDDRDEDPTIPLFRDNAYAWYLQNTGIVAMLMIFSSCLCCGSFWGLFCGDFHRFIKLVSVIGFLVTATAFVILLLWMVMGTWLLIMMGPEAILDSVCRNVVIYLVFMYVFAIVFIGATVIACVWQCHSAVEDVHARTRRKA